jgi:hypothetical protein
LIDRQRSAGYLEIRRRNGRCWRQAALRRSSANSRKIRAIRCVI